MSGTIIAGATNRQTIPYGDRPFVQIRQGSGYLTLDAYQFLVRLSQASAATVSNVGTVVNQTNQLTGQVAGFDTDITTLETEIAQLQTDFANVGTPSLFPPSLVFPLASFPPLPPPLPVSNPLTSFVVDVNAGAAVSLSSGTAADVLSLLIPIGGTFLLQGSVYLTGAGATTLTRAVASFGLATGVIDATVGQFASLYLAGATLTNIGNDVSLLGMTAIATVAAGVVYFLDAQATFGVSTLAAYGQLAATQIA